MGAKGMMSNKVVYAQEEAMLKKSGAQMYINDFQSIVVLFTNTEYE